jgi:hypothetical protein
MKRIRTYVITTDYRLSAGCILSGWRDTPNSFKIWPRVFMIWWSMSDVSHVLTVPYATY